MKILIDSQIFNQQNRGGISRFISILSKGLGVSKKYVVFNPIFYSNNEYVLKDRRILKITNKILFFFFKKPYLFNRLIINFYLKYLNIDIFITSYYDTYFLNNLKNVKLIVPVYDMIYEKFPSQILFSEKVINNKKNLLIRADFIIAISENTKKDILECYPFIQADKIKVIHLGNSYIDFISKKFDNNLILPQNYFLFVGVRGGYKNFNWLIQKLSGILKKYKLNIICVGGGMFSNDEIQLFHNNLIYNHIFHIEANDIQLNELYRRAIAFFLPSLYEGFGFPIIEAMSNNCLVVLNRSSCLPEIAGDAGCYYDIDNDFQFNEVVLKILNDENYRHNQIIKGNENVKKFTWQKCISETTKLISEV